MIGAGHNPASMISLRHRLALFVALQAGFILLLLVWVGRKPQ
jgi:hypothetical protein